MKAIEPQLSAAWEASKPFFHQLGKVAITLSRNSTSDLHFYSSDFHMLFVRMFHFSDAKVIIDYSLVAFRWLQENFPGYVLWAQDTGSALAQGAVATFQKIAEVF